MRKYFILIVLSLLLTGCTVDADRIYIICKEDSEYTYVYNTNDEFFKLDKETNNLIEYSGAGIKAIPALTVEPEKGDYLFKYVIPGQYKGTLTSVNRYLNVLVEDGFTYTVTSRDWNNIEVIATSSSCNIRILFNIRGQVRIYAVDPSGNPVEPLYLNL